MSDRVNVHGLQIAAELVEFTEAKALPGTGIDADTFWSGFAKLVEDLRQKTARCLQSAMKFKVKLTTGTVLTERKNRIWKPTRHS